MPAEVVPGGITVSTNPVSQSLHFGPQQLYGHPEQISVHQPLSNPDVSLPALSPRSARDGFAKPVSSQSS